MRHVKPTRHMRRWGYVVAAAAALSAMTPEAMAEDSLKVAVARPGAWDTAARISASAPASSRSTASRSI